MQSPGFVRLFDSTLRALAVRHEVRVLWGPPKEAASRQLAALDRLAAELPSLSHEPLPDRRGEGWLLVAARARAGLDLLRYLQPPLDGASKLRARAEANAAPPIRLLARVGGRRTRAALGAVLAWLRSLAGGSPGFARELGRRRPDLVVVTPLAAFGAPQADLVKEARRAGVRSACCVASWDNLTTKGLLHEVPDLVTVWNEAQRDEAVALHGVPATAVAVTGAPAYDEWFERRVATSRSEFCERVMLPEEHPIVLYLCSSRFIAEDETDFVLRWAAAVRGAGGQLAQASILVRPHPQNAQPWRAVGPLPESMRIWSPLGEEPLDEPSRAAYFDSIAHSAVVVGVNTSALIESSIVGRPVCTWLAEEFRSTQEGTVHFHHLVETGGGFLEVARTFGEHVGQLERALADPAGGAERRNTFLEAFVRPRGLDASATAGLVSELESALRRPPPAPDDRPLDERLLRTLLAPLMALLGLVRRWLP